MKIQKILLENKKDSESTASTDKDESVNGDKKEL